MTGDDKSENKTPIDVHDNDNDTCNKPQCKRAATSPSAAASGTSRQEADKQQEAMENTSSIWDAKSALHPSIASGNTTGTIAMLDSASSTARSSSIVSSPFSPKTSVDTSRSASSSQKPLPPSPGMQITIRPSLEPRKSMSSILGWVREC